MHRQMHKKSLCVKQSEKVINNQIILELKKDKKFRIQKKNLQIYVQT